VGAAACVVPGTKLAITWPNPVRAKLDVDILHRSRRLIATDAFLEKTPFATQMIPPRISGSTFKILTKEFFRLRDSEGPVRDQAHSFNSVHLGSGVPPDSCRGCCGAEDARSVPLSDSCTAANDPITRSPHRRMMTRIVESVLVDEDRAKQSTELDQHVQSRPLRARREAPIASTAPTLPAQIAPIRRSKPCRAVPAQERPRSSSTISTLVQPS